MEALYVPNKDYRKVTLEQSRRELCVRAGTSRRTAPAALVRRDLVP